MGNFMPKEKEWLLFLKGRGQNYLQAWTQYLHGTRSKRRSCPQRAQPSSTSSMTCK